MGNDQANTISEGNPELAQCLKVLVDQARPGEPTLPLEDAQADAARMEATVGVVEREGTAPEPQPKGSLTRAHRSQA